MRAVSTLCALALLAPPAWAQYQPLPCSTHPPDQTAENGFAPGAGETSREFCSNVSVPTTDGSYNCLWGDYYYVDSVTTDLTATAAVPPGTIYISARQNTAGNVPGARLEGIVRGYVTLSPPTFPQFTRSRNSRYHSIALARLRALRRGHRRIVTDPFVQACLELRAQQSAGYFVTVDRSAGTPFTPCHTGVDGGPVTDPCTNGDPNLRAVGLGGSFAPIGSLGYGGWTVPPTSSSSVVELWGWSHGAVPIGPDGEVLPMAGTLPTFRFHIEHDVASPTAVHIHAGAPLENGPVVVDLGDPTSPIDVDNVVLTAQQIDLLGRNLLYVDIHSSAFPSGEVRGQVLPAQPPLFADGFESGDTSAWVVP